MIDWIWSFSWLTLTVGYVSLGAVTGLVTATYLKAQKTNM